MADLTGWQDPKTDWKAADRPTADDLNRIEANTQAIEIGARAVSDTTAPTGSAGSLRQLIGWILNRLKAITGKAAWHTAPAITLESASTKITALEGSRVEKAGDTMTGALIAQTNTNYTTRQVRNVIISTGNPTGGSNGDIWIKYIA